MEHEVREESKMYTCDMCGKPTPNYREYSPSFAAFIGERGYSRCDECQTKLRITREWANEQEAEERMICPYCESDVSDPWEYEAGESEIECPSCGRTFEVEITFTRTYTTRRRIEDMPDGWNGGELL